MMMKPGGLNITYGGNIIMILFAFFAFGVVAFAVAFAFDVVDVVDVVDACSIANTRPRP
jgi:hypothetical protein